MSRLRQRWPARGDQRVDAARSITPQRFAVMAAPLPVGIRKDEAPQELVELRSHLDRLPSHLRSQVMPLCDKLGHFARLQTRLVRIAQDAVDQLQLDIKYLLFDL